MTPHTYAACQRNLLHCYAKTVADIHRIITHELDTLNALRLLAQLDYPCLLPPDFNFVYYMHERGVSLLFFKKSDLPDCPTGYTVCSPAAK